MTLNRFVFKTHKWLAVGVGLFTFLWFVSGVVMLLPQRILGGAGPKVEVAAGPGFSDIAVSIPQAVAIAQAAAGAMEVEDVHLQRLLGRLLYRIDTRRSGTHLVDAVSGERLEITADVARQIVAAAFGEPAAGREAALLRAHDADYGGPLPVWRIALGDSRDTVAYVEVATGKLSWTDRPGRWRALIVGTHTFHFLSPVMDDRARRIALILFSIVGTAMSMFGGWILWLQWKAWRAARRGSA